MHSGINSHGEVHVEPLGPRRSSSMLFHGGEYTTKYLFTAKLAVGYNRPQ
jgi:hypothetical protein